MKKSMVSVESLEAALAEARAFYGRKNRPLLITWGQAKFVKSSLSGEWLQVGLTLAPARESGFLNMCAYSGECAGVCLNTAGENVYSSSRRARVRRTVLWRYDRSLFLHLLREDMTRVRKYADKRGLKVAFRGDTLSDTAPESLYPAAIGDLVDQWIDYTKNPHRYRRWLSGGMSQKVHLTFSRQPSNHETSVSFIKSGGTATVLFRDQLTLDYATVVGYRGYPVHSGESHDRRWEDTAGCWIGLVAKGKARKDASGFVVDFEEL